MEPSEFDQLIQQKLKQPNDAHIQHINNSKAAIWAKIQPKRKNKPFIIPWYYTAAAVILLLFTSSMIFYKMNRNYRSEFELLSAQLENLRNQSIIATKNDNLINQLCAKIDQLELSKRNQRIVKEVIFEKQLVYKTDTVFLKQTEYIVQEEPKIISIKDTFPNTNDSTQINNPTPSRVIFFDSDENYIPKNDNSTALRIKLGNFKNN